MHGFSTRRPEQAAAAERIRAWTRARFALPEDAVIAVSEIACGLPGCPPLETVVAFWTDRRHRFKLFKPVAAVTEDDLPFAWLKDALAQDIELDCC
jgi:nitrate reductase delta subunit